MFDYIQNIRSHRAVPCTWDIMETVMKSVSVGSTCAEIADYREKKLRGEMSREDFETKKAELKKRLPVFCFHAHFKNGRRLNADAVPSGLSMLDIDHISDPETFFNENVKDRCKDLGIVLAHKTPSAEGLRLVFVLPEGMSLVDGQHWLAKEIGLTQFDEACKDLARCSFAVPMDYVLYIDKDGLFAERRGMIHHARQDNDNKNPGMMNHAPTKNNDNDNNNSSDTAVSHAPVASEQAAEPVAVLSQNLRIFDETVAAAGLSIENLNNVGTRHNSLITILSMGICRLMPQEQLSAVIAERMPDYSREKDCQDLIRDFYAKYTDTSRPMSGKLRKIYTDSLRSAAVSAAAHKDDVAEDSDATTADLDPDDKKDLDKENSALTKKIMRCLPQGLKDSLIGIPDTMRMPVLCSILPLAGAYADGVTVRYCDGATQRLGLMSIIVGPQASGKSACKSKVDLWMRQMEDEDSRAREIEEAWKNAKKSKKANEKTPEDPCVLIRSVPVTISCSTLLRRFKNSRGHCLFSFGEELDTLRKTNGAGSWSSKYDIYRLAFDNGKWGQDYNSDQAESGVVQVAYNFSILGTYGALRKCFRADNVENGLSSRIIVSEMPDAAFAPMPMFGQSSSDAAAAIDKAVTLLRSQTGFVDTPKLRKAIGKWVEDKRLEAMADGDLVKDTYRKRAAVIGFRCGVIARLLEGKESKNVLDFATMMAQYVLDEQCKIFGESLSNEYKQAYDEQKRFTVNGSVFDTLPPVFTLQDIQQLKGPSSTRQTLYTIISRWKKTGWIEKVDINKWRKTAADVGA